MQSPGWNNVPALHRQRQEIVKQQLNLLPHRLIHAALAIVTWGATMLCAVGAYGIHEDALIYTKYCVHHCKTPDWSSEYALYAFSIIVGGIAMAFLSFTIWMIVRIIEGKKLNL